MRARGSGGRRAIFGSTAPPTFFLRVYALVRRIPRGRVVTYGQVALALGVPRGARAVGWALRGLNTYDWPDVPWHRVVGQGGRIALRDGGGPGEQRRRLTAEGVRFRADAVDLARHAWERPAPRGVRTQSRTGKPQTPRAQRRS